MMDENTCNDTNNALLSALEKASDWVANYQPDIRIQERGTLISVGDGVAWIKGLPSARIDELLNFEDGSLGMVFDLCEDQVGAIILNQTGTLIAGQEVHRTSRPLGFPANDDLLGRVIDPTGHVLDGKPSLEGGVWLNMAVSAPEIVERDTVKEPLYTGIRMVDAMIPIGRGQRQLIIGDEGLGRTSIALNTVLNQKGKGMRCVYVAIGQKRSAAVNVMQVLKRHDADSYTTLMVADAGSPPGLQYLAPFSGSALASHWMRQGHHVLIVYDDLSSHARSYRELSLLLRRPPGREAYPGDVFSVHARLLEQATCLSADQGGGSVTALPIAETQQGEIAAYIPTNLISITDGQIYLDRSLFAAGFRPAIDVGRSVSRIGGKAQHPAIKKEAGRMKLDYSRFLELEIFTRFGAKLDSAMQSVIRRGQILRELFKQDRFERVSPELELAWMIAFNQGLLDDYPPSQASSVFEKRLLHSLEGLSLDSPREAWIERLTSLLSASAHLSQPHPGEA
ncbi:F0F1 ATP synthase subunit alpha [Hahella ganghwensis]|uniref:F0F1 ATP synthase subunit alpha n=1 Tax=Hahella ganghwensis TaxID=286420 RepID=UPI0003761BD0|nr:F0F1 ATP synthase subunit alpha [Hahella ganghwensis]